MTFVTHISEHETRNVDGSALCFDLFDNVLVCLYLRSVESYSPSLDFSANRDVGRNVLDFFQVPPSQASFCPTIEVAPKIAAIMIKLLPNRDGCPGQS